MNYESMMAALQWLNTNKDCGWHVGKHNAASCEFYDASVTKLGRE